MLYIEVILSKYFYFSPNTVLYKVGDLDCQVDNLIWSIVCVPFWKQYLNALVVDVFNANPWSIADNKIKEIKAILPSEFFLSKKAIWFIHKIANYYFSSLSKTAWLFLPAKVFDPTKRDIEKFTWDEVWEKENYWNIEFDLSSLHKLNTDQQFVYEQALKNDRVLIKWITWSWKTEIYKYLVLDTLKEWKQALITVPEIALTPQLLTYFKKTFPNDILWVVHSKITPAAKAKIWHWVKSWTLRLIIGSRSSLFMPFENLWLICVDEQHEWTYKNDQSPRYRLFKCVEIIWAEFWAKIVLWSATPDFNNYYNFINDENNNYKILELKKRVNNKPLPKIELIDLKDEYKKRNYSPISEKLKYEIANTINLWEKVILFLNQRGFNSSIVCKTCGWALMCNNCDTSLTFHFPKNWSKNLVCHYCWLLKPKCDVCPKCNWSDLNTVWTWTQKVEKEIVKLFPKAKVYRVDSDTIKSKQDLENVYEKFKSNQIDILIWTQMIAKWLDFEDVTLVWVILADTALHIPDYKSSERTFSLLVQVAWRSGRGEALAKVLIQTFDPAHPAIYYASSYNFSWFYEKEIEFRKECNFPPFVDVLKLTFKQIDKGVLQNRVKTLISHLKEINEEKELRWIITNAPAFIPRINNNYIWNIVIRWKINTFEEVVDKQLLKDWIIDRDPNMIS